LFLLLAGGAAYAASHLAKNSVGTKQLKKNAVITAKIANQAVTGAKIKNGSLTGTQIDERSLGTVPSADSAARAQTAVSADDATTLDGSPSNDFARSNRFLFGQGTINATTTETLFSVPGQFALRTTGLGSNEAKLLVENISQDEAWEFVEKEGPHSYSAFSIGPGNKHEFFFDVAEAGVIYAMDPLHPEKQVLIDCTYEFISSRVLCTANLSPSIPLPQLQ
jgi:hypothetical protein